MMAAMSVFTGADLRNSARSVLQVGHGFCSFASRMARPEGAARSRVSPMPENFASRQP